MEYIKSFFGASQEDIFRHEMNKFLVKARNWHVKDVVFCTLVTIYNKHQEEKVDPEALKLYCSLDFVTLSLALSKEGMYKKYDEETKDLLGKFGFFVLEHSETSNPLWFLYLVQHLYDVLLWNDDILQKVRAEFDL